MGKLLILLNYIFFVFSSDIKEQRRHIHVKDKKRGLKKFCKFWIEPDIQLESNIGFSHSELNEIEKMIHSNIKIIHRQSDSYFMRVKE